MQQEITVSGNLLNEDGTLAKVGYARSLLPIYDRKSIKANSSRIKEWDYYLITCDDFAVALTVDDNSYMGLMSASFIDFKKPFEKTTSIIIPLTNGKVALPASSKTGDTIFRNKRCSFRFLHEGDKRHLKVRMDDFDDNTPFYADITLSNEPKDSMVIVTPFPQKKTAFYYNQKIIGMKAEGFVQYKGEKITLPDNSFGLLDWGRGVWTYENTWFWGAGQGMVDEHLFGFNIGYGFGDTSAASENMLFYDGCAHKLDGVTFNIPKTEDGKDDFLKKWTFSSNDGRFEMEFSPIIDRAACTSALVILSDQHQVFGKFTGKAILDDNTVIELKDFLGFAEKVHNKW